MTEVEARSRKARNQGGDEDLAAEVGALKETVGALRAELKKFQADSVTNLERVAHYLERSQRRVGKEMSENTAATIKQLFEDMAWRQRGEAQDEDDEDEEEVEDVLGDGAATPRGEDRQEGGSGESGDDGDEV